MGNWVASIRFLERRNTFQTYNYCAAIYRDKRKGTLSVDGSISVSKVANQGATQLDTDGYLWLGTCPGNILANLRDLLWHQRCIVQYIRLTHFNNSTLLRLWTSFRIQTWKTEIHDERAKETAWVLSENAYSDGDGISKFENCSPLRIFYSINNLNAAKNVMTCTLFYCISKVCFYYFDVVCDLSPRWQQKSPLRSTRFLLPRLWGLHSVAGRRQRTGTPRWTPR